jgi:S1-C subfamily serine protease
MALPEQTPPSPIGEPPPTPPSLWRRPLLAGLVVVALAALAGGAVAHLVWPPNSSSPSASGRAGVPVRRAFPGLTPSQNGSSNSAPSGNAAAASGTTDSLAAQVDPGLVDINTTTADIGLGAGTGMVVTSAGEVITNNHVIDGATRITATDVGNGKTYTARVVGYDKTRDVAVLMLVGASGLKTVPLGDSSTLHVGASVVTVGNAGGVGGTPSAAAGSVSALDQAITAADDGAASSERLTGLIEVNGQLQPGDSGGPLVDASGNVVGMDTAASATFSYQSSSGNSNGFAIPINEVLTIAKQIVAGTASATVHIGPSAGAFLGVLIAPLSAAGGLPGGFASGSGGQGVFVEDTVPGGPADAAGLTQGDTITALNGRAVNSPSALTALMAKQRTGHSVRLSWLDGAGNAHTSTLRLAAAPPA